MASWLSEVSCNSPLFSGLAYGGALMVVPSSMARISAQRPILGARQRQDLQRGSPVRT